MRVAIYIRSLLHGGAEKQSILLACELQKVADVTYIVHTHDPDSNHLDYTGVENIVFLKGNILNKIFSLYKIFKKNKIDNLICFLPVNNIVGTFTGKLARVPNILCGIRGSKNKGVLRTSVLKFICNKLGTNFISNNHLAKEVYVGIGFDAERIHIIHNSIVVPEKNSQIIRTTAGKKYFNLISVGRFVPEKDFITLVRAIKYLTEDLQLKNINLNLVGYGPLEQSIREEVSRLDLQSFIQMHDGRIADLNALYRLSDLYISSSVHEGMPNTVMEAMSFKLPVVATNAGDSGHLVSKENGFLIKSGSIVQMATAIRDILIHRELYTDLSNNSYTRITEEFNVTTMCKAYIKFLK